MDDEKVTTVRFSDVTLALEHVNMTNAALQIAARWNGKDVEVHCAPREESGWLEWAVCIPLSGTLHNKMVIGIIQRAADAEIEAHS